MCGFMEKLLDCYSICNDDKQLQLQMPAARASLTAQCTAIDQIQGSLPDNRTNSTTNSTSFQPSFPSSTTTTDILANPTPDPSSVSNVTANSTSHPASATAPPNPKYNNSWLPTNNHGEIAGSSSYCSSLFLFIVIAVFFAS